MINKRVEALRTLMQQQGIDYYFVPSEDFHQSEYVGEHFKAREYITGFTGSAGFALISQDEAHLWTDGRYFLQAEKQLEGTPFKLQKMGEAGYPRLTEYLLDKLVEGSVLGFDGRCVSQSLGQRLETLALSKGAKLVYDVDLVGDIWKDRPEISKNQAFFLEEKYSGESTKSKLERLRAAMQKKAAGHHIISSLDDICWLFNYRGSDVLFSPLVLSYAIIAMDKVLLFIDETKLGEDIRASFEGLNIEIKPYNDIYAYLKQLKAESVLIDNMRMNYALYKSLPASAKLIESRNPTTEFKTVKNDVEVANFRKAHIQDGIAVTKFMYWLKHNVGKMEIDEIAASDKLEDFRKEREGYLWPSFDPISGYAGHGAIVHYSATRESASKLEPRGLYLCDTGGNYYEGTTDITRTYALGELTEEEKYHFSLVLKSHIDLACAIFPEGTGGYALDVLARKAFWDRKLNFNHGTGHGVGYLLNVHEGPQSIRHRLGAHPEDYPLLENMMVTIEPGIYIAGSHGIRIENIVVVKEMGKSEYGKYYYFDALTLAPIDLDALDVSLLNEEEKAYLNDYHKKVYELISPHLTEDEAKWLKQYTRAI